MCGSFFFQAEDGIRDLVRSRGLGDVYKRQDCYSTNVCLQDFSLILTFNIGMNYSQEVKQIGFKLSLIHI